MKNLFEILQSQKNRKIDTIDVRSGLPTFDKTIEWSTGSMHLIAAISHIGKTALACQIARETVKAIDKNIYFLTTEMTEYDIAERISVQELTEEQQSRIFIKTGSHLDEELSILELTNIGLLIIDHLGGIELTGDTFTNSTSFRRNAEMMQKIRYFCIENNCIALLISQLDPKTTMTNACQSSLSYSSEFFRYVDSCTYMFINSHFECGKGRMLSIKKNRTNGKLLDLYLTFDTRACLFQEVNSA